MTPLFQPTPVSKPLELRYYQREAIEAAYDHIRKRSDNPCIVLPTGAGKTPVQATICNDVVTRWNGRVLVLAHVKELIEQTADTLSSWFPSLKVGVYSAGLGRRETRADVLVAGIQSVHKKGLKLAGSNPFKLVMVDEAHRIPTTGDGMYRNLLTDLEIASPKTRVIGLTATPYRLKGGWVCGPNHFLNAVCYEAGVRELIAKGYLCPLISKQPKHAIDDSQIKIKGGEFEANSMSAAFDSGDVVDMAVAEIAQQTANRSSVLIFCCDVAHANHVSDAIASMTNRPCGIVTGDQANGVREQTINAFKAGRLKYLVNVNVLTEGFDARQVDCVVLLRSTLSPGLYYQMVGRGLRTHDAKSDCLVLDFGGNVIRHGCVDAIKIKSEKLGDGEMPSRVCPECDEIVPAFYSSCSACGYTFPAPEDRGPNHEATADEVPITSDQVQAVVHNVTDVTYSEHIKQGASDDAPRTMRVTYFDGLIAVADEWVCVEHSGFAGDRAADWWSTRTHEPMPDSASEAARLAGLGYLSEPIKIAVMKRPGERFKTISKYWLGEKPELEQIVTEVDEWGEEVRVKSPKCAFCGQVHCECDIPF
jgi:DNA repair protein RadD